MTLASEITANPGSQLSRPAHQQELTGPAFRETTRIRAGDATNWNPSERDPAHLSALQALSRAFHALAEWAAPTASPRVGARRRGRGVDPSSHATTRIPFRQRSLQRWREIIDEVTAEIAG